MVVSAVDVRRDVLFAVGPSHGSGTLLGDTAEPRRRRGPCDDSTRRENRGRQDDEISARGLPGQSGPHLHKHRDEETDDGEHQQYVRCDDATD